MTCRISSNTDATDSILHGVDSTVFEVGELKYKEGNDVPLVRDLAKDWHHDFRLKFFSYIDIVSYVLGIWQVTDIGTSVTC